MNRSIKTLGRFHKPTIFDHGIGALLPEAYKKFYKEWKLTIPTAVHHIPEDGTWKRDEVTGEVHPIQNVPIPVIYPREHNNHLWGGEGIVQGFQAREKHRRRVPHFWVPVLKRTVVYSEILNKHISVVVTDRTISLINSNYGFDHYILKTPACDLKSLLSLSIKRRLLEALQSGCPAYNNDSKLQEAVNSKYSRYLAGYTHKEIEWYGYSFTAACKKMQDEIEEEKKAIPLKHVYRAKMMEKLREADIKEASEQDIVVREATSWLTRMNPFTKKHET